MTPKYTPVAFNAEETRTSLTHYGLKKVKPHLVFWILFIIYELSLSYSFSGRFSPMVDYFTYYSLNIILFYMHTHYIVLPLFNKKSFYLLFIIYAIIEIAVYLMLKYTIGLGYHQLGIYTSPQVESLTVFIRNSVWRAIYFIGLSTAYGFIISAVHYREKVIDLEGIDLRNQVEHERLLNELLQSEIAFRKAQINPHFVFNSLGFIHNYVSKFSDKAGDLIITLSEIMRYALAEPMKDGKVPLDSEIEHIQNYILLNQHRFSQKLYINFSFDDDIGMIRLIPLVLITIVENIFKYGDLRNADYPAKITLKVTGNQLHFLTSNAKLVKVIPNGMNIGMTNVKKRLDMYYKDNYSLNIDQDIEYYNLKLIINLPNDDLLYT